MARLSSMTPAALATVVALTLFVASSNVMAVEMSKFSCPAGDKIVTVAGSGMLSKGFITGLKVECQTDGWTSILTPNNTGTALNLLTIAPFYLEFDNCHPCVKCCLRSSAAT